MSYIVSLSKEAIKALEKTPDPYYSKIKKAIYSLADNPRPHGYKKLKGRSGFRIRQGDYRVIYDIVDEKLHVFIIDIGPRGGIYD